MSIAASTLRKRGTTVRKAVKSVSRKQMLIETAGVLKRKIDPVAWQKKIRSGWDDRFARERA